MGLSPKQIRYVLLSFTNTFVVQPLHNLKSTNQHKEYDNRHVITTHKCEPGFVELYASFTSRDNCFKSLFNRIFLEHIGRQLDTPITINSMIYRRLTFHLHPLHMYHPLFVIDYIALTFCKRNTTTITSRNRNIRP